MKVHRGIGGSYVVVDLRNGVYIDARKDVRAPWLSFIEVVRNGRVVHTDTEFNKRAPETIMNLVRDWR